MASKSKEYPGIKLEKIDDVKEKKNVNPKDASFLSASKEAEKTLSKIYNENPDLASVKKKVESSPENSFRQVGRVEVKAFDASFLDAVEKGLAAIGKIIANPRTFIKETHEIENVEKAKKVSVASIQHFATHSQYLRTVEENGEVIPDKILTIHSETNTAIYENRFVMTLIKRTLSFVEQRYKFVVEHGETLDSDELYIHSKVPFGGVNYQLSMRLKASIPSSDAGESEKNNSLLRRLRDAKTRCGDYLHSNFMTQMKGAKDITSPVHMTNMLLKHPDYHEAYLLWEFIDQYESLGVSYDVKESAADFDDKYLDSLYRLIAEAMLTLRSRHIDKARAENISAKRITPQVIFGMDEVTYEDSRFFYDAYPEAKEEVDPTSIITEEERKGELEKKVNHLLGETIAEKRLSKAVTKDKDKNAYEDAKSRGEKKAILEEKLKEKKEKEKALEKEKELELKKEEAKRKEARKLEEDLAYEEARRKLLHSGGEE